MVDCLATMLNADHILQTLRSDGHNRGQKIFYSMMQFFQQKALETFYQLTLRGVDSSLCQELPQSCVFNIEPKLFFTGQYANPRAPFAPIFSPNAQRESNKRKGPVASAAHRL